ncbi:MAG TPA: glycosyl hydrolase family 8 [Polyangiaceae bacterium]|nr:glycosyl hydrolase family 8 [Polyangiaceae bacterium]
MTSFRPRASRFVLLVLAVCGVPATWTACAHDVDSTLPGSSDGGKVAASSGGANHAGSSFAGTSSGGFSLGGSSSGGSSWAASGGVSSGAAAGASSSLSGSGGGGSSSVGGGTSAGAGASMGGSAGATTATGGAAGAGSGGFAGASGAAGIPGLGSCVLPNGANFEVVQANYEKWKATLLTADGAGGFLRVQRPNSGTQVRSSNSEGIAYGLEIAVYMNDQTTFDQLWKYEQIHLGKNGLMEWEISPTGTVLGSGAASDGDEDMAFALVMAHAKWGGQGTLSDTYLNYAKKQIDLIWKFEVDHSRNDVLTPGDNFADGSVINISYFAPAYYRIFGQVTGKQAEWNRVAKTSYDVIEATLNAANKNQSNGLVPAWSTPAGVPMAPPGSGHPTYHQLDSCRTPFRVAQDYCWFNEPRALDYLKKITAFYAAIGANNIVDGYDLDGKPHPKVNSPLAAFVGGAAAGAMALPEYAKLRDESYVALAGWQTLLGDSIYYNYSWSMLSLLMLTGKFVNLQPQ